MRKIAMHLKYPTHSARQNNQNRKKRNCPYQFIYLLNLWITAAKGYYLF